MCEWYESIHCDGLVYVFTREVLTCTCVHVVWIHVCVCGNGTHVFVRQCVKEWGSLPPSWGIRVRGWTNTCVRGRSLVCMLYVGNYTACAPWIKESDSRDCET